VRRVRGIIALTVKIIHRGCLCLSLGISKEVNYYTFLQDVNNLYSRLGMAIFSDTLYFKNIFAHNCYDALKRRMYLTPGR